MHVSVGSVAHAHSTRLHAAAVHTWVRRQLAASLRSIRRKARRLFVHTYGTLVGRCLLIVLAVIALVIATAWAPENAVRSCASLVVGAACAVLAMTIHPDEFEDDIRQLRATRQAMAVLRRDLALIAQWTKSRQGCLLQREPGRLVLVPAHAGNPTDAAMAPDRLVVRLDELSADQVRELRKICGEGLAEISPEKSPIG